MKRSWKTKFFAAALGFLATAVCMLPAARAAMSDYTWYPLFMQQTVPPNILFVVDQGTATLPAAYGNYLQSSTGKVSSNYKGSGLCNTNTTVPPIPGCPTVSVPTDFFNSTVTYFGMFDPLLCSSPGTNSFSTPVTFKTTVSDQCPSTSPWDGNFLNWLTMRKIDLQKKVIIGGKTLSASNTDGSANTLLGEPKPDPFSFVKFVPSVSLVGRVPTSLPLDTASFAVGSEAPGTVSSSGVNVIGVGTAFTTQFKVGDAFASPAAPGQSKTVVSITNDTSLNIDSSFTVGGLASNLPSGSAYYGPGRFFGMGGGSNAGTFFVNSGATVSPFTSTTSFPIAVDLTWATATYRQQQSLGLLQNLRTDNMRVGVMFTNSTSGQAANVFRAFDSLFNPSAITGIRNTAPSPFSPLAESAYEALCYYRNSQGPCYSNTPADFTATPGASGDPFFFVSNNQLVSCCKSFILMISPGLASADGSPPNLNTPFPNLFPLDGSDTIGITTVPGSTATAGSGAAGARLDDVAFFGQTHDIRDQTSGPGAPLPGTQNVTFYAVNSMGGAGGSALLASAAKFGGFVDQNGNGVPDPTGQPCTFPANSSLNPTPGVPTASTSSAEWDVNKDCIPDTYFEASQGSNLQTTINNAIASILKRAASGTSVSVLATSSTGEGAIYQAYFLPETAKNDGTTNTVKWYGFTQGLFVDQFGNIREDTNGDGRLTLETDQIITLSFNTGTSTVSVLRCPDADGDGIADSTAVPPCSNVGLSDIKPIWEAGRRLAFLNPDTSCTTALAGVSCRRILAWADVNNDHLVQSSEVIEFTASNMTTLCPYLNGANVATCSTLGSAGQTEATNLINFHRGSDGTTLCTVAGDPSTCLRDRSSKVLDPSNPADTVGAQKVWKLGDVVDATPSVVGSPKERFDVIYGDTTYTTFFTQYKNRRQVAYVGANDGMLHAFNVGFFNAGDDPCTTPVEHGLFTVQPFANNPHTASQCTFAATARTGVPPIGAELWAFIPHALLPHLKWYADINYTHVAYVDLKPKVTDVRIFCGDTAAAPNGSPSTCINGQPGSGTHPGGWGTILIGGMRFGGSCGACVAGSTGGVPMTVTADFGSGTQTRTFYAVYFVLDITDPEQDPVLLWAFTDARLGLATSFPAVLRVSPVAAGKTDPANARWLAVFGTGPTGYTGISTQTSQFFVVDIALGPTYNADQTLGSVGNTSCSTTTPCVVANTTGAAENVRVFSTGDANSFMGDIITLDANLDFKVDVIYAGNVITSTTPAFIGKMYRLTTGALNLTAGTPTTVASWGITSGSAQVPSALLASFTCSHTAGPCIGSTNVGPVTAASTVSADTTNNIWLFFGSGRFLSTGDKTNTDTQYFFGVKDPCATSATCTQTTQQSNLLDVSSAVVCNPCAAGTNEVTGVGTNTSLGQVQTSVQNVDGWFTTLRTAGERSLSAPTILGGTVFFTTFIPTADICVAAGSGNLYALYYLTGTAYNQSVIGTTTTGGTTTIKKSIALGTGLPSQMAVQIGSAGAGASGSSGSGSGCAGRVTGFMQASTGVLGSVCGKPALSSWSRMLSWRDL